MTKVHHRTYDKYQSAYDRIHDALEGEDAVVANAARYLRQMPGMSRTNFAAYARGGSYYPVAERTLRGMTGLALRNAPQIDIPDRLQHFIESATYDGNPLSVFIENALREILSFGRYLALLDFPTEGTNANSVPYLSTFDAPSILDWRYSLVNGKEQVTYLRLHEDAEELEGQGIEQHLVCYLEPYHVGNNLTEHQVVDNERRGLVYKVARLHVRGDAESLAQGPITPHVNGKPLTEIPVVCFSPYNLTVDVECPPMLDIVNLSLKHFQNSCDLEHSVHLTAQPTYVRMGANAKQKSNAVGPGVVWDLPTDGDAKVLEVSGEGAKVTREAMTDKENRMASLGARFITDGQNRNEAEGTARMRHRSEHALLYSSVEMLEAGLLKLLKWAADWVSPGSAAQVAVKFSRDFVSSKIDAALAGQLLKMWMAGAISHETFIENMRTGEIVAADRSFAEEKDRIEEEGGDMSGNIPDMSQIA